MRGTTPKITYSLPFSADLIAKARLSVEFEGKILLRKDTGDFTKEGNLLSLQLTREDTVTLPEGKFVQVQLQVQTTGGECLVAAPESIYTGILLDEEALT